MSYQPLSIPKLVISPQNGITLLVIRAQRRCWSESLTDVVIRKLELSGFYPKKVLNGQKIHDDMQCCPLAQFSFTLPLNRSFGRVPSHQPLPLKPALRGNFY